MKLRSTLIAGLSLASMVFCSGCIRQPIVIGTVQSNTPCILILPFQQIPVPEENEFFSEILELRLRENPGLDVYRLEALPTETREELLLDFSRISKIGKDMGASLLITGRVTSLDVIESEDQRNIYYTVDAYILNVEKGYVEWTYGAQDIAAYDAVFDHYQKHADGIRKWVAQIAGDVSVCKSTEMAKQLRPSQFEAASVAAVGPAESEQVPPPTMVPLSAEEKEVMEQLASGKGIVLRGVFKGRNNVFSIEGQSNLEKLIGTLKKSKPKKTLEIWVHTDATISEAVDLEITQNWSKILDKRFQNLHPDLERTFVPKGGTDPLVPNLNEATRKQNRRVQFFLK